MPELTVLWEKTVGYFHLMEFEQNDPNGITIPVAVAYSHGNDETTFNFGSWGMDKEDITHEQLLTCCQAMLDADASVSCSSFAANLNYAENYFYDEDDEDDEGI